MENTLRLQKADLSYVDFLADLEARCYPADEAASKDRIRYRVSNASDYFYILFMGDEPVGFVNGTLTEGETLKDETMATHDPKGTTLCIHSVVTDPKHRRKHLGTWMLTNYVQTIKEQQKNVELILLICKEYLLTFYSTCGFTLVGPSDVVHGKEKWFEMKIKV